jgi:ferrous iron transport protein B
MNRRIRIVLAGNPNAGKTTIFNNLTGSRQHVGNYPGVTVEYKEGRVKYKDYEIQVTDLPGTYSLTAYSQEEVIARNSIIDGKPDAVVNIIDSSNLERNLYLTLQLMEMDVPLVLVFNMSDLAEARGIEIDIAKLSLLLNLPIIPTTGHKGTNMDKLLDAVAKVVESGKRTSASSLRYEKPLEEELSKLEKIIRGEYANLPLSGRWLAIKLLEGDEDIRNNYTSVRLQDEVRLSRERIYIALVSPPESVIATNRYNFISETTRKAVRSSVGSARTISDRIDSVVTHRWLGIPLFLGMMYMVFLFTFSVGDPFMGWIESGFGWLSDQISNWWVAGSESAIRSLLIDGIIGGVGGVLVFLPNILLLFLAISILEDSGYMARAAFIMDRLMQKIGLPGKSFIPMLIGFGCSVPAIMATRTLENKRDRLVTMLVIPLMSCGARLPIYTLIIPAFFPQVWQAPLLWIIYLSGIILAIISAFILRKTILKGESEPFIMELPTYKLPTLKGLFTHAWERGWLYLKKAGTIILGISILLWALTSYPQKRVFEKDYESEIAALESEYLQDSFILQEKISELKNEKSAEELSYTIAGRIGQAIEPVIGTMGFDWKIGTALIGAFAAKEVFVAQLGIVYSVGEVDEESQGLRDKLRDNYTPLVGLAMLFFSLISAPCMATIAITRRESNSWKWALFQLAGLTLLAWVVTSLIYQIGSLFGY